MYDFYKAYRVSSPSVPYSYIAVGIRPLDPKHPDKGVIYLVPGSQVGRSVHGPVKESEDGSFTAAAPDEKGADGEQVVWRFEVLTAALFKQMVIDGDIEAGGDLTEHLTTDENVQVFYQTNFLSDYWVREWKNGTSYAPPEEAAP